MNTHTQNQWLKNTLVNIFRLFDISRMKETLIPKTEKRERERETETDRQTDRQRERER